MITWRPSSEIYFTQDKLVGGHCDNLDVIMPVLLIKIVLEQMNFITNSN